MTDDDRPTPEPEPETNDAEIDLKSSPFESPGVEGLPFKRGSAEDRAIQRILDGSAQNAWAFESPGVEGIPFKRGSAEDRAIQRILRERDERERRKPERD